MPIDPNIALGFKTPDATANLSSLLSAANTAQTMQSNAMTLGERQAGQQIFQNIDQYKDPDGNLDFNRLSSDVIKAMPTTGSKYISELSDMQTKSTAARSAVNKLDDDNRARVANTLATIPVDAPPEVVHKTLDALDSEYGGKLRPAIMLAHQGYDAAAARGPDAVAQWQQTMTRSVLPQTEQQNIASGSLVPITTNAGTQLVQGRVGAAQPQGSPVGQPFLPPNQITTSPTGRMSVVNTATGSSQDVQPVGGASQPPVNFPRGESKETFDELQGQRTAAQKSANAAPQLHDLNKSVVDIVNSGNINTGVLGGLIQHLKSATGISFEGDGAVNYDTLGKLLERSALTAAQGMGPQTNAGLEAQLKANGTVTYNPQTIKKIAYLNDALVHGTELYRNGLEKAIQNDPNGVFAKRQFDQQWAQVATPQALRLKNAVDNGNQEEVQNILKEVGGPKSKGAAALSQNVQKMLQLAGQQ